ncbi:hypothetical protein N1F78_04620 [Seonamhaeicola sp. MEBiC1930]|uniref:hypothetical protein n=1 Tax=Seonamhaeicola sp. MEBiC01930 TaxID=2976768 RepID=UPI00324717F3
MKRVLLFFVFCFFFYMDIEAQCAMCRAVLESEETQSAAKGINNGIKYLMAVPYLLVGGIIFIIYRKYSNKTQ